MSETKKNNSIKEEEEEEEAQYGQDYINSECYV